jgi:hypothetical protein
MDEETQRIYDADIKRQHDYGSAKPPYGNLKVDTSGCRSGRSPSGSLISASSLPKRVTSWRMRAPGTARLPSAFRSQTRCSPRSWKSCFP